MILEGVSERRHARQTNSMLDLPERITFQVVLNPISSQLWRLLIKAFRYRGCRRSPLRRTMADCTVLCEKMNSLEEILVCQLYRILLLRGFATQCRIYRSMGHPGLQPAGFCIGI